MFGKGEDPAVAAVGFGADWSSHIAIPNQNAGWSWKLNVPPVPSCFGRVGGSFGSFKNGMIVHPFLPVPQSCEKTFTRYAFRCRLGRVVLPRAFRGDGRQ